jgi:hypothetical protein
MLSDPKKKPGKVTTEDAGLAQKGYETFLGEIKERVRSAQLKAAVSVNRELVLLYWQSRSSSVRRHDRAARRGLPGRVFVRGLDVISVRDRCGGIGDLSQELARGERLDPCLEPSIQGVDHEVGQHPLDQGVDVSRVREEGVIGPVRGVL